MSHSHGQVLDAASAVIGHFEYAGTVDIARRKIFATEEACRIAWRREQPSTCDCIGTAVTRGHRMKTAVIGTVNDDEPLALSYGMGVDSTAVLVGWWLRGIRPDWIGHAQVGNEWPETYAYRPIIDAWLERVGFPQITDVQYRVQRPKHGHYSTLEENCLVNETLPSLAFGYKKCSLKWKGQPLDAACADHFADHLEAGGKVRRAIGYDAGPCDSRRGGVETTGPWTWIYPLREWGWDRDRCEVEIAAAGLPVPPKSACFYCPSTKPAELLQLARRHPHLARRAVELEDRARPHLTKIEGLWGRGTKGTRGGEKKPGSWRVFLAEHAPEVLP